MSTSNTHWRKFHETEFLGSFDLVEQGLEEKILTIENVVGKTVKDDKGRDEVVLTCSFLEEKKPMVLNATNCKAIQVVSGTPIIENWSGVRVTLYIQKGIKAFGKVVDGLRIRDFKPKAQIDPTEAIEKLKGALDIQDLQTIWKSLSKDEQQNKSIINTKNTMKNELS